MTIDKLVVVARAQTDKEKAEALKLKLTDSLAAVIAVLNEAKDEGFHLEFMLGADALGRNHITRLVALKTF